MTGFGSHKRSRTCLPHTFAHRRRRRRCHAQSHRDLVVANNQNQRWGEFPRAPGSTDEHQHIVISPDQAARPVVELALDVARDLLRVQRWPELMRAVATQRNPQMST